MSALKIGWGRREYSLDKPVNIPGQMHMRRSEGVLDPLYITALVFDGTEAGGDAAIFVSVDATGLGAICEQADKALREARPDIPVDNVIIGATHTHTAMSFYNFEETFPDGSSLYSSKYVNEHFCNMLIEAVGEAWDNRKEGGIAYGYGYAVVGHSRRVIYSEDKGVANPLSAAPNGHGVMYGNTNDPTFIGYEAGADHFLNALYTFDTDKKLTGMIVNVPCPSQTGEMLYKLSADFWAEVRTNVAKEFGSDVYVLPQCASAGDMAPRILHYKEAQKRRMELKYGLKYDNSKTSDAHGIDYYNKIMAERMDMAERITDAVKEVYAWAKKDIDFNAPVYFEGVVADLTPRMITDRERKWCEDTIEQMKSLIPKRENCSDEEYTVAVSRYNAFKNRNERAIRKHEKQKTEKTVPVDIRTARIGEVGFAANMFELYIDYMHRIQARSPFKQTFLIELTGGNGLAGYLPTKRGIENKGYSASIFCNQLGDVGGQELVENTLKMLNNLAQKQGR